jgi:hypothetical protein
MNDDRTNSMEYIDCHVQVAQKRENLKEIETNSMEYIDFHVQVA